MLEMDDEEEAGVKAEEGDGMKRGCVSEPQP